MTDHEPVLIDMTDPRSPFRADIDAAYAELRARGPVAPVAFTAGATSGPQMSLVTHYAEGAATLLDDRFSSDPRAAQCCPEAPPERGERSPLANSLLSTDPPDHTRLRKLVRPAFSTRAIEALRPSVQALADGLLDDAERAAAGRGERTPDREMDLIATFAAPLSVTVICELLGIPPEDRATIHPWTQTLVAASGPEMPAQTRAHVQAFIAYLGELFDRKRQHPTADMVSTLVHAEADGDTLDEHELLAMVFLLFIAGYVTTMSLIGNGVLALLTHPDQRALVEADPALVKGLVEESLRYWGPVDNLTRTATQDVEIAGRIIRRGELVMISLASPTVTPRDSPTPACSTSPGPTPAGTSPSARACTCASARSSPVWRRRSPSPPCSGATRGSAWRCPPASWRGGRTSCAASSGCPSASRSRRCHGR